MPRSDPLLAVMVAEQARPEFLDYVRELRCYIADGGTSLDFMLNVISPNEAEDWHDYISLRILAGDPVIPWDEVL